MLYDFPLLNAGGIERLRHYIEKWHYRLVVLDVLARVEPAAKGGSEKTYHDIYRMFAPLQDLHRRHPVCLVMLTHLRKAEADDIFDTLHGSVAYQGVRIPCGYWNVRRTTLRAYCTSGKMMATTRLCTCRSPMGTESSWSVTTP